MAKYKTVVFPEEEFNTLVNLFQLMAVAGLKLHGTGNAIPSEAKINAIWYTLRDTALIQHRHPEKYLSLQPCPDCGSTLGRDENTDCCKHCGAI